MKEIFNKAGIEVTEANKRDVDEIVHGIVGVGYKHCPSAWKEVKRRLAEDEEGFVAELREEWKKRKQ